MELRLNFLNIYIFFAIFLTCLLPQDFLLKQIHLLLEAFGRKKLNLVESSIFYDFSKSRLNCRAIAFQGVWGGCCWWCLPRNKNTYYIYLIIIGLKVFKSTAVVDPLLLNEGNRKLHYYSTCNCQTQWCLSYLFVFAWEHEKEN